MTRLATIDRDQVLDVAEALIGELGPAALTLDALAAQAGVSKGGLQYAFKSKDGLILAMVQRVLDQSQANLEQACKAPTLEERLASWLDGLVRSGPTGVHNGLLAAIVQNPRLMDKVAQTYRAQLRVLAGGEAPQERVTAICLAADGLMLGELLGLIRFSRAERRRIAEEIVSLARRVTA